MGRRGNPFFRFQQFSIEQDRCAMKVGVDGILLGAWASVDSATRILDIGTGTGLIALMLAQRNPLARIVALEIDVQACAQAKENVMNSTWAERIELFPVSFQDFVRSNDEKFDLIVSNPPFFTSRQLKGARGLAREQHSLSPEEILIQSSNLLSDLGRVALIVPISAEREVESLALAGGLYVDRKTYIRPVPEKPAHRVLIEWTGQQQPRKVDELTIEKARHHYSAEYKALTRGFLLHKGD